MPQIIIIERCPRRYTFMLFIFDLLMLGLTGGLWLIWMVIRGMR